MTLYDRMQLDEHDRVEGVLNEMRAIHNASLTALAVNAPSELPKHESRYWDAVNQTEQDVVSTLEAAAQMIAQVALAERIARRQRRRARGN